MLFYTYIYRDQLNIAIKDVVLHIHLQNIAIKDQLNIAIKDVVLHIHLQRSA